MHQAHQTEINTLKKLFAIGNIDFVFDIGANSGGYAERLRNGVGYRGTIASYEPIPELAAELSARQEPDWLIHNCALSHTAGTAEFYLTNNTEFSSLKIPNAKSMRLFNNQNGLKSKLTVECRTLAGEFVRLQKQYGFRRPFLKMDTQGSDLDVVRGGLAVIGAFYAFQSELSVTPIYSNFVDFRQALYFYEGLGFRIAAIFLPNEGHFPRLIDTDVIMINEKAFQA